MAVTNQPTYQASTKKLFIEVIIIQTSGMQIRAVYKLLDSNSNRDNQLSLFFICALTPNGFAVDLVCGQPKMNWK